MRPLASDALLAHSEQAVAAAANHYGLALDAAAIAAGPDFRRNAKTGEAFDASSRDAVHRAAADAHAAEIDLVERWATAVADAAAVPKVLLAPLLP